MEISISLDPSVGKDLEKYLAEINTYEDISIHCDVMRDNFVSKNSVTVDQYNHIIKNAAHPVDVHLMVSMDSISEITKASQGKMPRSITVHAEILPPAFLVKMYMKQIKSIRTQIGLAIDLDTPVERLNADLLRVCDVVTIMSVKAGKSGQKFNETALEKARTVKKIAPNARIIMDGGINPDNIELVKAAGTDTAVIGNYIYSAPNRAEVIAKCKAIAR